jgi:hypothetical protein
MHQRQKGGGGDRKTEGKERRERGPVYIPETEDLLHCQLGRRVFERATAHGTEDVTARDRDWLID